MTPCNNQKETPHPPMSNILAKYYKYFAHRQRFLNLPLYLILYLYLSEFLQSNLVSYSFNLFFHISGP